MEKDWISELPNNALEHVISFLTLEEAVRTSILSKRWRRMNVCSILSNLNFSNLFNMTRRPNSNVRRKNRRLLNVVDKILLGRSQESSLGVENLFLKFPRLNAIGLKKRSLDLKIEKWMKCLAKPGLVELNLLMMFVVEHYYDFPLATVAAVQSLQKLALMGFKLTSLSRGDSVRFSSLRILSLSDVVLDDDVMQNLLKCSPLLENLEVDGCCELKFLQVRQPQLKMLVVRVNKGLRKVWIHAPKLEVLKLSPPKETIFVETCLPCLRIIKFKKSRSSTVNTLVEFRGLKLPMDVWFAEFLPLCPLLEELSIKSCPIVHNINVSTSLQALKRLRLSRLENMVNIAMIAPNLEKVYLVVQRNFPVVELNASNRLEVKIEFTVWGFVRDLWHDRLAIILGYFNHSRAVKLSFPGCLIPKEKRKDFPIPLYGTKYLEFTTVKVDRTLLWEHVDCMLSLSPQPTNLTIREEDPDPYNEDATEIVLELVYEENKTFEKSSSCACCAVLATKCWRHGLKEVKIQEFVGDEADKESLKRWLWEEVEELRITEVSFDPDSIYGGKYTLYDQLFK